MSLDREGSLFKQEQFPYCVHRCMLSATTLSLKQLAPITGLFLSTAPNKREEVTAHLFVLVVLVFSHNLFHFSKKNSIEPLLNTTHCIRVRVYTHNSVFLNEKLITF